MHSCLDSAKPSAGGPFWPELVNTNLSLSLQDLLALTSVDLVAVNQCSGKSHGFFQPRVPGAQWGNGSMGNARWTDVRLKNVLDRAGIKAGAIAVRFNGLDEQVMPAGPDFMKSLPIDHARDGEVMITMAEWPAVAAADST